MEENKREPDMQAKLGLFAQRIHQEQIEQKTKEGYTMLLNHPTYFRVEVKSGNKYAKVDVGGSGKYMVDLSDGAIYGIKAYGVIHKGHQYGTLDTIDDWFWGDYTAVKK